MVSFHVYALCYNEERTLPFFLNHYKKADKIYILDNYSTDNSENIINEYKQKGMDIEIVKFDTNNEFCDYTNKQVKNTCWKHSIGMCDYVIVQDLDEFLTFKEYPYDFKKGLSILKEKNVTHIVCSGYEMCCSDEEYNSIPKCELLSNYIHRGWFRQAYSKPCLFNPNVISDTNFEFGQHLWNPVYIDPLKKNEGYDLTLFLLHFKHLGKKWEVERIVNVGKRMGKLQFVFGCSLNYARKRDEIIEDVNGIHSQAKDITDTIFTPCVRRITCELKGDLGTDLSIVASTLILAKNKDMFAFFGKNNYQFNVLKSICYKPDIDIIDYVKVKVNDTFPEHKNIIVYDYDINNIKGYESYISEIFDVYDFSGNQFVSLLKQTYKCILVSMVINKDVNLSFYKSAYNKTKMMYPNVKFILFSKNKEWCNTHFPKEYICDEYEDHTQLYIMSKLDIHIVSDLLSFWGALLATNKIVVTSPRFSHFRKDWICVDE